VQAGMLLAGALVGFIYERAGLAGILAIDGTTYVLSAGLFYLLRHGYLSPQRSTAESGAEPPAESERAPISILETMEPNPARGVLRDIEEGLNYLRTQPAVLALGLTYACMMAGVISANVIVVALASDLLHVGARGYGFIEAGWALGAVAGGFAAAKLSRRRPFTVMIASLFVLACGHALFPYAGFLAAAVVLNALFGACRAIVAVLTQSSILAAVPSRLMGRTQSAFAVMATVLQVVMSLLLGWLAQHSSLQIAFLMLGLLYAAAIVAAMRARDLSTAPATQVPAV
jgi:DHA3 family macrolide efflux protein-like MFS transporter